MTGVCAQDALIQVYNAKEKQCVTKVNIKVKVNIKSSQGTVIIKVKFKICVKINMKIKYNNKVKIITEVIDNIKVKFNI